MPQITLLRTERQLPYMAYHQRLVIRSAGRAIVVSLRSEHAGHLQVVERLGERVGELEVEPLTEAPLGQHLNRVVIRVADGGPGRRDRLPPIFEQQQSSRG